MARYWDDRDGNGKKLTDGRVCLVIKPDDSNLPEIRTYGRDKEEVLDKVAKTTETAQAEIHRLRSVKPVNPAAPSRTATPSAPATVAPTTEEIVLATADLANPAKAGTAVKTLLRSAGVNVDQMAADENTRRISRLAQQWENSNPEFPADDRNRRQLMNTAVLRFGARNITLASLDAAYQELLQHGMLFDVEPEEVKTVHPDGSPDSRTVQATTYRRNSLSTPATPVVNSNKPRYTRAQVEAMNSKVFRDKLENEPGFREWYNKEFAAKTA